MKTKTLLAVGLASLLTTACEIETEKDKPEPPQKRDILDQPLKGSILNVPWEFESGHLIQEDDRLRLELFSEPVTACEPSWWKSNEAALVLTIDSTEKVYTGYEPNLNVLAKNGDGSITLIPSDVVLVMSGTREDLVVGGLAATMDNDVRLNGNFAVLDCRQQIKPDPPSEEDMATELDQVLKQWWSGDGGYFNNRFEDQLALRFIWQDNDENTSTPNDFDLNFACINGPRSTDTVSVQTDQNDDLFYLNQGVIFQKCWSQTHEVGSYSRQALQFNHTSCWNRENNESAGHTRIQVFLENDTRLRFSAQEYLTPTRKGNSCSGELTADQ